MNAAKEKSTFPASFDPVVALQRVGGDQELLAMAIDLGIGSLPRLINAVQDARSAGDVQALGDAAHTLKGMAATFEARQVGPLAAKIEEIAGAGDFENAMKLIPQLEEKTKTLGEDLAEFADRCETGDLLSLSC
tara:strand:+ start:7535 stop:7936 length:402 start_codon:yes stop_codon:yes gene_type:complete